MEIATPLGKQYLSDHKHKKLRSVVFRVVLNQDIKAYTAE